MIEHPLAEITAEDVAKVRPWIEAALAQDAGTHNFEDVLTEVALNQAVLWVFDKSAVVTQSTQYPRCKVMTFWLAGGNMADMLSHMAGIEAWGCAHGVTRFAIIGRRGWLRVLERYGYSPMHYVTVKEAA